MSTHTDPTIRDIVDVFLNRRRTVIAIILATAILAAVLAFFVKPVYRATVTMSPADFMNSGDTGSGGLGQLGGLAALAGVTPDNSNRVEESLAVLESRQFSRSFIEQNNLMPVLFAGIWDEEAGDWNVDDPEDVPTMQDAVRVFQGSVMNVVRDRESGLIDLRIEWGDPAYASDWANSMIDMVNAYLRQKAVADAEKSIDYLNSELEKTTSIEIRGAIFGLMESQIQNIMFANVQDEYAFSVIDPAIAPEDDDFIRPNRPLIVALGVAGGILLSLMFAGFVAFRRSYAD